MSTSTPTTPRPGTAPAHGATPALGIGLRYSLHPHADDFVEVILGALADVEEAGLTAGLVVRTDEVSTYVGAVDRPAEQRLATYLAAVVAAASRRSGGGHVVAHVLLSRGCPGEVTGPAADAHDGPAPAPVELAPTGVRASAQWSLYPLMDGTGGGAHMVHIEEAVAAAVASGLAEPPAHYATLLRGDVSEVLAVAVDAWARVGEHVPHVVTHLTLSVGSPSQETDGA